MEALFDRFTITMTRAQAESASHQGRCDDNVAALARAPNIARQLRQIAPAALRAELREYGAWDDDELSDHAQNLQRIVWIAAGNIKDEYYPPRLISPKSMFLSARPTIT